MRTKYTNDAAEKLAVAADLSSSWPLWFARWTAWRLSR